MADRTAITGTLKRSRVRRRLSNWAADFARLLAEEAGLVEARYYKETAYVSGETLNTTGRGNNVWSLASLTAFEGIASGARVRFTAIVRRWDNGNGHSLGGTCLRVRDVEVLPPRVEPCGHEEAIAPHAPCSVCGSVVSGADVVEVRHG